MRKHSLYTPSDAEIREAATSTESGWVDDAFDRWLTAHDAKVRADAVREHASKIREVYPEDIFPSVTQLRVEQVHAAFKDRGLSVDQWSAHLMRFAAAVAEAYAAEITGEQQDES